MLLFKTIMRCAIPSRLQKVTNYREMVILVTENASLNLSSETEGGGILCLGVKYRDLVIKAEPRRHGLQLLLGF